MDHTCKLISFVDNIIYDYAVSSPIH